MTYTQGQQIDSHVYVIVRRDLSWPQRAVQACHGSIEATKAFLPDDSRHPSLVLCGVKNEQRLKRTAHDLNNAGISYREFREPDIGNQLTSIVTEPLCYKHEFFKRYRLLQEGS